MLKGAGALLLGVARASWIAVKEHPAIAQLADEVAVTTTSKLARSASDRRSTASAAASAAVRFPP